ncbi:MAG: hypothetical protein QM482_07750 [Sulfurospirillum sp.]
MNEDKYKQNLTDATKKLKACQKNLNFKSCFNCEKLFDCKIRKEYIDAVYKSMSKGQSGGFEF